MYPWYDVRTRYRGRWKSPTRRAGQHLLKRDVCPSCYAATLSSDNHSYDKRKGCVCPNYRRCRTFGAYNRHHGLRRDLAVPQPTWFSVVILCSSFLRAPLFSDLAYLDVVLWLSTPPLRMMCDIFSSRSLLSRSI